MAPSRIPGVQTLRNRQSSLVGSVSLPLWGEAAPYRVASSGFFQGSGARGGMNRRGPVSAPYRMPLNEWMPSWTAPRTLPCTVVASVERVLSALQATEERLTIEAAPRTASRRDTV